MAVLQEGMLLLRLVQHLRVLQPQLLTRRLLLLVMMTHPLLLQHVAPICCQGCKCPGNIKAQLAVPWPLHGPELDRLGACRPEAHDGCEAWI